MIDRRSAIRRLFDGAAQARFFRSHLRIASSPFILEFAGNYAADGILPALAHHASTQSADSPFRASIWSGGKIGETAAAFATLSDRDGWLATSTEWEGEIRSLCAVNIGERAAWIWYREPIPWYERAAP